MLTPQQWKKAEFDEVREHIKRNKGNPVKFLLQVIDGHEFDFVELVNGVPITIKRPASLNTRVAAASKLIDKILPDLRAHDISIENTRTLDLTRISTADLFSRLGVGFDYNTLVADADFEVEPTATPSLSPAQTKPALDPSPRPLIPLAEAALLVPTSDLPAGLDKAAYLEAPATRSQTWEPVPPADLTSD